MKYTILATSALCLLLAACGGDSDSSSSSTSGTSGNDRYPGKPQHKVKKVDSVDREAVDAGFTYGEDMSKVNSATGRPRGANVTVNNDGSMTVNGGVPKTYSADMTSGLKDGSAIGGAAYGIYEKNPKGGNTKGAVRAVSMMIDSGPFFNSTGASHMVIEQLVKEGRYASVDAFYAENSNWTGVQYDYMVRNSAGTIEKTSAADGTFTFDSDAQKLTGQLGDVALDGGYKNGWLNGDATLGDMKGEFKGYTAHMSELNGAGTLGEMSYTVGSFAGDDKDDQAFAGGWFGEVAED